jgi:hypothetical protein
MKSATTRYAKLVLALATGMMFVFGLSAQAQEFPISPKWGDVLNDPETREAIVKEYEDPEFLLRYGGPEDVEPKSKLCCNGEKTPGGTLTDCRTYILICNRPIRANCPGGHICVRTPDQGWVCECKSGGKTVIPSGNLGNLTGRQ